MSTSFRFFNNQLKEYVKLDHLANQIGISDFTKYWFDKRKSDFGTENDLAKLQECKINNSDVSFIWLTLAGSDNPGIVDPNTKKISKGVSDYYTLEFRFQDMLKYTNSNSIPDINSLHGILMKCNILLWSNDPSFHWQGMNYNLSQLDGSLHPTNIPPEIWRNKHHDDNFLSKHLEGLIENLPYFYEEMLDLYNDEISRISGFSINKNIYNSYSTPKEDEDEEEDLEYYSVEDDEIDIEPEENEEEYLDTIEIEKSEEEDEEMKTIEEPEETKPGFFTKVKNFFSSDKTKGYSFEDKDLKDDDINFSSEDDTDFMMTL